MPSASNSPVTARRRKSRISNLAECIQHENANLKSTGNPVLDKVQQQLSVASMVQRFERDKSMDGAKTRSGSSSGNIRSADFSLKKWPPSTRGRSSSPLSSSSSSLSADERVSEVSVAKSVEKSSNHSSRNVTKKTSDNSATTVKMGGTKTKPAVKSASDAKVSSRRTPGATPTKNTVSLTSAKKTSPSKSVDLSVKSASVQEKLSKSSVSSLASKRSSTAPVRIVNKMFLIPILKFLNIS